MNATRLPSISVPALCFTILFLTACATSSKSTRDVHPNRSLRPWTEIWNQKMNGFISDLSLSADGSALLLATVPDQESNDPNSQTPLLSAMDPAGRQLWATKTGFLRAQAISNDGKLILVSNHSDQLVARDAAGNELWSANATCRPFILEEVKKILCYHDEDAEPEIAFDLFDFTGKKLDSYPVHSDVLALKLSRDRQNIVLGLIRGEVILTGPDLKTRWKKKIKGEIVDLAVSDGTHPEIVILYDQVRKNAVTTNRSVAVLDSTGKVIIDQPLKESMEQVEIAQNSDVVLYGRTPGGAALSYFAHQPNQPSLIQKWSHPADTALSYGPALLVTDHYAVLGFDDIENPERHSHIGVFDFNGALLWDLPLLTEEGAYLYVQDYSEKAKILTVGMDDGSVKSFQLK